MKRLTAFVLSFVLLASTAFAQDLSSKFDGETIRKRVIRLSADDFEGRGPGTAGANGLRNILPTK